MRLMIAETFERARYRGAAPVVSGIVAAPPAAALGHDRLIDGLIGVPIASTIIDRGLHSRRSFHACNSFAAAYACRVSQRAQRASRQGSILPARCVSRRCRRSMS